MLGSKGGSISQANEGYNTSSSTAILTAVPDLDTIDYGDSSINVDDIPF